MTIREIPVPFVGENCYLLKDDNSGLGAIIDPGGAAESIVAEIEDLNMSPCAILLTHGHYDHTGAVKELREKYPDIPVYLHPADAEMTKQPDSMIPPIGETKPYDEGDEVQIGDLNVSVLHTPGHTPGSVTLLVDHTMFSGDTLFRGSCGRTDLPGGSTDDMMASLKRLAQLEGDWDVLPGHEGPTTLQQERLGNFYMLQAMNL